MWKEGGPKQWAGDLLSGLQHLHPGAKRNLPGSWRLFGAWVRHEEPSQAAPTEKHVVLGVAGPFWADGYRRTAVLLLLALHTSARSGEFIELEKKHLSVGTGGRSGEPRDLEGA